MHWYALYVRSSQEQRVCSRLSDAAIETFCPTYQQRSADRKRILDRPFFPGYLFSRVARIDGRLHLPVIPELVRIVGAGAEPLAIPDCEMSAVQQIVKLPSALPHQAVAGDLVRVRRGPLTGIEGVVIRLKNSTRIVVTIGLLQQGASAEIDADAVEVIRRAA